MQHCFCNSYFYVIFHVLFWLRSEYDTFLFTAHLYIKQFSFNYRVIIVADLTVFYRIIGVSSSMNINRKNKRKQIKLKIILGLWQSNIFLSMHVPACALFFFSFSVHFADLIIFELNFFLFKATGLCARVPVWRRHRNPGTKTCALKRKKGKMYRKQRRKKNWQKCVWLTEFQYSFKFYFFSYFFQLMFMDEETPTSL